MQSDAIKGLFNQATDRQRMYRSFLQVVRGRFFIAFAFCFSWLWTVLCCIGPDVVLPAAGIVGGNTPGEISALVMPAWVAPVFFMAMTSLIIALHFKFTRRVIPGYKGLVATMVVMGVAALLHLVWWVDAQGVQGSHLGLYVFASLLTGVGASFFRVEIDRVFGWVGSQQTLYQGIVGTFLGAGLFYVLSILPQSALFVSLLVSAPAAVFFLWQSLRGFPRTRFYQHGRDVELPFPAKFVTTSFVQGAAIGVMYGVAFFLGLAAPSESGNLCGRLFAVGFLFVSIIFLRLDFNRLIYKVGFPLVALGFLLCSLLPAQPMVGGIVLVVGFCYLDLVLWSLGACLMKNRGLPASWIASCPGAALFFGVLCGNIAVAGFAQNALVSADQIYLLGSLVACLLLATALFLSSNSNLKYGWGTVLPGDEGAACDDVRSTVQFLATDHDLTNRESEVFLLLAKGKSRRAICEALCVSPDTVKTHVRSVYRKLSVHAQQELIDFVGREKEALVPSQQDFDKMS